ncbi:MAG: DUF3850 domain-containing protein [Candidatus Altiarchaeota archaeon]|nr:DUF3850 domain-containing protein [Candidatus Altiarchaeota archaeon]
MVVIEKKITPEYFSKVLSGEKNFEVRLADWTCKKGDILVLREHDPKSKKYTGREIRKEVGFVLRTKALDFFSKEEVEEHGFLVIGLK